MQEADIVIVLDTSGRPRMLGEGAFGQVWACQASSICLHAFHWGWLWQLQAMHFCGRLWVVLCLLGRCALTGHRPQWNSVLKHWSQVLLGRWKGALVAVKVLRESTLRHANAAQLTQFQREAEMLQSLAHPNILSFYGACFSCKPVRRMHLLRHYVSTASRARSLI